MLLFKVRLLKQSQVNDNAGKMVKNYAEAITTGKNDVQQINFRYLEPTSKKDGVDVMLSADSVKKDGALAKQANKSVNSTVISSNRFAALEDYVGTDICGNIATGSANGSKSGGAMRVEEGNLSDDDCEEVYDETTAFLASLDNKGASTPSASGDQ
ncbi:hypothetical protein QVD17_30487 [Tagetes erecta]|uniref:Uncharacterized protein n=1 Tax=Tagetes erecta TaxID=13708 RepID=A0AAD8NNA3_TARER|nr:hypothetical protein QVD17_30487 [Tagetes erecta]